LYLAGITSVLPAGGVPGPFVPPGLAILFFGSTTVTRILPDGTSVAVNVPPGRIGAVDRWSPGPKIRTNPDGKG
jgi:hypothetical protein